MALWNTCWPARENYRRARATVGDKAWIVAKPRVVREAECFAERLKLWDRGSR
jgi:hypothetical protein